LPVDQVVELAEAALQGATSAEDACRRAVDILAGQTNAVVAALLHVHDHLRCVAAAGSWSVFSSVRTDVGVIGRVYRSGVCVTVTDPARDRDYVPLGSLAEVEICAPVIAGSHPIGVLNVEWPRPAAGRNGAGGTNGAGLNGAGLNGAGGMSRAGANGRIDTQAWRQVVTEVARRLGERIRDLGGPPTESASERLLRHVLAITTAYDERELLVRSLAAAREVSGLSTPLLLLPGPSGIRVYPDPLGGTSLAARFAALPAGALDRLATLARRHGSMYTLGSPDELEARGFRELTALGVRTMITVPTGPARDATAGPRTTGAVLLVVDEEQRRPNATTVNLLELLATHAWTSLERLVTLDRLRERAVLDPLTGLRHHGQFGERLAATTPGRTALLLIDVDRFKLINDTYGHQAGDRALVDLARTLQRALRSGDELYRVGGDEFAAVIEVQVPAEAQGVAERLVDAARRVGHPISVGVAICGQAEPPEGALRRADDALYQAKRAGRNRVQLASAGR
jgi:diguanylate cyclase (GGDEF)-like protein